MSATLERLRTLRRQAGQGVAPARLPAPVHALADAPTPACGDALPAPASAHARTTQTIDDLRRLLRVRAPERLHAPPRPTTRALPGVEMAPGLHCIEHRLPWEAVPARVDFAFARREGHCATDDLLCFDTETTGLAGGTGTRAFMIGTAAWRDDGLHVRQWLMASMQAERALLEAFAATLQPSTVLVSYNGRSYDAPLLSTRFRLARLSDPLPGRGHLDLLHPSRRRWRGRWENCRLATIERRVLGIVREDDLPGSEAPAAWLRYLRGGSSRDLCRVAEHNRQDLVSLARLLLHLHDTHAGAA
jgi:hypothetical protein